MKPKQYNHWKDLPGDGCYWYFCSVDDPSWVKKDEAQMVEVLLWSGGGTAQLFTVVGLPIAELHGIFFGPLTPPDL